MSIVPTAQSVLESSLHGRQRREERGIQKIDLQRARRYGMKEAGRFGRLKYTYGGVVFIYDPHRNREVTSFKSQDVALASSGTRATEPIILKKGKKLVMMLCDVHCKTVAYNCRKVSGLATQC